MPAASPSTAPASPPGAGWPAAGFVRVPVPEHRPALPARLPAGPAGAPQVVLLLEAVPQSGRAFEAVLATRPELALYRTSAETATALRWVRECRPATILLDIGVSNRASLALTLEIKAEFPAAEIMVFGVRSGQGRLIDFLRAGVSGFLMQGASAEEVRRALRTIAVGGKVLPPALTTALFAEITRDEPVEEMVETAESDQLTDRERQVMELISSGCSNKEIAMRLEIALHTVKSHVHNLLNKLQLTSRLEVAAYSHAHARPRSPLVEPGLGEIRPAPEKMSLLLASGGRGR